MTKLTDKASEFFSRVYDFSINENLLITGRIGVSFLSDGNMDGKEAKIRSDLLDGYESRGWNFVDFKKNMSSFKETTTKMVKPLTDRSGLPVIVTDGLTDRPELVYTEVEKTTTSATYKQAFVFERDLNKTNLDIVKMESIEYELVVIYKKLLKQWDEFQKNSRIELKTIEDEVARKEKLYHLRKGHDSEGLNKKGWALIILGAFFALPLVVFILIWLLGQVLNALTGFLGSEMIMFVTSKYYLIAMAISTGISLLITIPSTILHKRKLNKIMSDGVKFKEFIYTPNEALIDKFNKLVEELLPYYQKLKIKKFSNGLLDKQFIHPCFKEEKIKSSDILKNRTTDWMK